VYRHDFLHQLRSYRAQTVRCSVRILSHKASIIDIGCLNTK